MLWSRGNLMRRPLLIPAVSLASGIAAAKGFQFLPVTVSALSAVSFFIFFLLSKSAIHETRTRSIFIAALCFLAGFAAFYLYGPGAPSASAGLAGKGPVALTARVTRPPEESAGNTRLILEPAGPVFFPEERVLFSCRSREWAWASVMETSSAGLFRLRSREGSATSANSTGPGMRETKARTPRAS